MRKRALSLEALAQDAVAAPDIESFASGNLGHIGMETVFALAKRLSLTDVPRANALLDTPSVQARVSTPCMRMDDGSFVPLPRIEGHMTHREFSLNRSFIPPYKAN